MTVVRRAQQAIFAQAMAMNKAAGTGGGTGFRVQAQIGSGSGGPQNFNALAYAPINGTQTIVPIGRTCSVKLEAILVTKLTVGANNGKVRLNPNGMGATSGDALYGQPYFITTTIFLFLPVVLPGTYVCQVDACVDNVASTIQVIAFLVIYQFAA